MPMDEIKYGQSRPGEEAEAGGQAQLLCGLGELAGVWDHGGIEEPYWNTKLAQINTSTFMWSV